MSDLEAGIRRLDVHMASMEIVLTFSVTVQSYCGDDYTSGICYAVLIMYPRESSMIIQFDGRRKNKQYI